MFKNLLRLRSKVVTSVSSILMMLLIMLLANLGLSTKAFAASHHVTLTSTVTGTVTALPAGMPATKNNPDPVAISLETALSFTNFANQAFIVEIIDSATGAQILSQPEKTDSNGQNNDYQLIPTQQQFATIPSAGWKVKITASGLKPVSARINSTSGIATFDTTTSRTTGGTTSSGTTSSASTTTGTTTVTNTLLNGNITTALDTTTGNIQIDTNLAATNFDNQLQIVLMITDQATGTQILRHREHLNASVVIPSNLTAIPTTWRATITDSNGNVLADEPIQAPFNGLVTLGQATFVATN